MKEHRNTKPTIKTLSFAGIFLYFLINGAASEGTIDFDRDIRPILAENCFHCHGPDQSSRKADLRLDTAEGAFADLGGYHPIVAGNSEESEMIVRIFDTDPDSVMPPPEHSAQLSEQEKQILKQWVNDGATWQKHWSYRPVTRPDLPPLSDNWSRNPVDLFIQKKQNEKGLKPNEEADRFSLARRAALDIIGFPVSSDQLWDFVEDASPNAYERFVDRLLESKHYGEHRARFWLDSARYSDTHGLHLDNYREIWPWRDWVVNSFNRNQPFDQFAIEQLAGDLLPNRTKEQLIATGFVRNNATSSEAGSIPEELQVRYMIDRTETVSTVFLGMTAGCAACHDHKFDPISQKEFYQMAAFFNNSEDPPMDGNMRDTYPVMVVPYPELEEQWEFIKQREISLKESLQSAYNHEPADWWTTTEKTSLLTTHPVQDTALEVYAPFEHSDSDKYSVTVRDQQIEVETPGTKPAEEHPHGKRGIRFVEEGGFQIPTGVMFQPDEPVTVSFWLRTPDDVKGLKVMNQWGEEDEEKGLKKTGWNIEVIADGAFEMPLRDDEGTLCNTLMPSETPVKPKSWQHVAIRYSGGQAASSISYFIDGQWRLGRRLSDVQITDSFGEHMSEIMTLGAAATGGGISDFRIYSRWLVDDEVELLSDEFLWKELVERKPAWKDLTASEKQLVSRYYHMNHNPEAIASASELSNLKTKVDYMYARSPTTLVMKEKAGPATAHVLLRGEYDKQGETVSPGTPAVLPPLQADQNANRLDLARWLVDGKNPLTARVAVNQIWQSLFGTGLVGTTEDFGVMGEKPSHPELLDWLAAEFQDSGWDVKALIRLIVTSATYRQNSHFKTEAMEIDPENRFLARGPRRRLDAEVIRDQSLAVSGILNRKFGGPPVRPYQPEGVWKAVAFQVSNTNEFVLDSVEKLHRRSLYTFWKRTAIPPAFAAFDAPSREECSVRRERTNTPLQALVLMNDTQHVEAARKLAEYLVAGNPGNNDSVSIAKKAFGRVVGRPAGVADVVDMVSLYKTIEKVYREQTADASQLAATGELPVNDSLDAVSVAAWTVVINTLLNRDDVLNQS